MSPPPRSEQRAQVAEEATQPDVSSVKAVILAGGRGTRLAPYTSILPKPLMPIGERSILETVVDQLAGYGFNNITFCVGYLSHLIRAVFDTRWNDSVAITYVQEEAALGTAAPLRLVEGLDDTFILMNGDVLTTLDYRDLVGFHRRAGNILTVATHKRRIRIDYGVVHIDESNGGSARIKAWDEKPELVSSVSMGVYVAEPEATAYIPDDGYFDFPDLVRMMLAAGEKVGAYDFGGLWFDIGRHDDYAQAVETWTQEMLGAGNENGHHPVDGSGNGHGNGHVPDGDVPTIVGAARGVSG